jgi:hypothetical protein
MRFQQGGDTFFTVSHGIDMEWTVHENNFEAPLASFHNQHDAYQYANYLAKTREGVVKMQERNSDLSMDSGGAANNSRWS